MIYELSSEDLADRLYFKPVVIAVATGNDGLKSLFHYPAKQDAGPGDLELIVDGEPVQRFTDNPDGIAKAAKAYSEAKPRSAK